MSDRVVLPVSQSSGRSLRAELGTGLRFLALLLVIWAAHTWWG